MKAKMEKEDERVDEKRGNEGARRFLLLVLSEDEETEEVRRTMPKLKTWTKIGEIGQGQLILFRPSDAGAKAIFALSPGWLATLETVFDGERLESLAKAQGDAAENRAMPSQQA